jgi:hypothetical protein
MKKYNLNTANVGSTHLIHSKSVVYLRNQRKINSHILEDSGFYDTRNEQDYLNSLNKRRLLKQWEKWRMQVKVAPHLPGIIETIIYENTFDDIEILLIHSHQEDISLSITSQTIQAWFEKMKQIAESLNRELDACYWQELSQYFRTCFQLKILTDMLKRAPKDH